MKYWLLKSEPNCYSVADFKRDRTTVWSGVRNYTARNNLKAMELGDICLFYRSVHDPAVQGLCKVIKAHYPDPADAAWVAIDLEFMEEFPNIIPLKTIKNIPFLSQMELVNNTRLSVQKVTGEAFALIHEMAIAKTIK